MNTINPMNITTIAFAMLASFITSWFVYGWLETRKVKRMKPAKPTTPAPTWTKSTPQSITTELRVSNKLFIEVISNHDKTYCYQPVWAFNEAFFDDIEDAKAQSVAFVMAELETALDGLRAYQGGAE